MNKELQELNRIKKRNALAEKVLLAMMSNPNYDSKIVNGIFLNRYEYSVAAFSIADAFIEIQDPEIEELIGVYNCKGTRYSYAQGEWVNINATIYGKDQESATRDFKEKYPGYSLQRIEGETK